MHWPEGAQEPAASPAAGGPRTRVRRHADFFPTPCHCNNTRVEYFLIITGLSRTRYSSHDSLLERLVSFFFNGVLKVGMPTTSGVNGGNYTNNVAGAANQRKQLIKMARLNLKGQGIILKKIAIKDLQACYGIDRAWTGPGRYAVSRANSNLQKANLPPGASYQGNNNNYNTGPNNAVSPICHRLRHARWMRQIRAWGRDGLSDNYLKELVRGSLFVNHANVFVALKAKWSANKYRLVPCGFICYGTTPHTRTVEKDGVSYSWQIKLNGVAADRDVAEIEALITDGTKGVGTALLEYAIADIASRKSQGRARYDDIVLYTTTPQMKKVAVAGGMQPKAYKYMDGDLNVTRTLTDANVADKPTTQKCYYLDINARIGAVWKHALDRVVPTWMCPLGAHQAGWTPKWQICR